MYKLDLGVESPYLGTAYADEAFGKRIVEEEVPPAGLGQGKGTAVDREVAAEEEKMDDCRMWYAFSFLFGSAWFER